MYLFIFFVSIGNTIAQDANNECVSLIDDENNIDLTNDNLSKGYVVFWKTCYKTDIYISVDGILQGVITGTVTNGVEPDCRGYEGMVTISRKPGTYKYRWSPHHNFAAYDIGTFTIYENECTAVQIPIRCY